MYPQNLPDSVLAKSEHNGPRRHGIAAIYDELPSWHNKPFTPDIDGCIPAR